MIELDHTFSRPGSAQENHELSLDLDRLLACVEGGRVLERLGPDAIRAEILVRMGSMSMTFAGTVTITDRDAAQRSATLAVASSEVGGSGRADAEVRFTAADGGGTIHTQATITGKAASMGEGVVRAVLDALIKDFAARLGAA